MNYEQFELYRSKHISKPHLDAKKDFHSNFAGTLLFGNISEDGDLIHIYVKDGLIHQLRYYLKDGKFIKESLERKEKIAFEDLIHDYRFYPEACSWNIVHRFIEDHVKINFCTFSKNAPLLEEGEFYKKAWYI